MSSLPSPGWTSLRKTRRQSSFCSAVKSAVDRVGLALQGPLDPADLAIGPDGQAVVVATPPDLLEGELEQRQRSGAAPDVVHQQLDQPRLGLEARQPGGAVDRPPQLVLGHRADQHLVVRQRGGQVGVRGAAGIEIGPHRQHDDRAAAGHRRRVQEVGDEVAALGLVVAEREDLLELVHQHDEPLGPGRLAQGQPRGDVQRPIAVLATLEAVEDHGAVGLVRDALQRVGQAEERLGPGPADRPRPRGAAVELAVLQGRHQPRAGQRRLAAARGPDDRQEPVLDPRRLPLQGVEQPFGQRLAAEEERGVLDVEQLQAAIRVLPLEGGPSGPAPGSIPRMPQTQPVERLGVIEGVPEFDPGGRDQEARELAPLRPLDARQQDGDDPEGVLAVLDPTADRQPHLLVVPGAEPPGPMITAHAAQSARAASIVGLPGRAGDQVPLVEPGLEVLPGQSPGQFLDQGLVGRGMRQEYVEASGHGSQSSIGSSVRVTQAVSSGTGGTSRS